MVRALAFYLPQFHPTAENNEWWGEGFTEWTNVAAARPLFRGHDQPRVPADLGFYDLRLPEVQENQARLAREHGIEGFCVWHYWFEGRRLLHRPVDQVLSDPGIDFPFCLTWANESWSRRWLGDEKAVLMRQAYSEADDEAHAQWLAEVMADGRYIRVAGRPMFGIYRPTALPDPARTIERFRTVIGKHGGVDPYLFAVDGHDPHADYLRLGFDAVVNFEPQLGALPHALTDGWQSSRLPALLKGATPRTKIFSDAEARNHFDRSRSTVWTHRSVMVSWDNTPRRGRDAVVLKDRTPAGFEEALRDAVDTARERHADEAQLVWINAWNEWAEGNYLEPDLSHGRAFLEAARRALAPR